MLHGSALYKFTIDTDTDFDNTEHIKLSNWGLGFLY